MKQTLVAVAFLLAIPALAQAADGYRHDPGRGVPYRLESECNFGDCAHSGWETNVWNSDLTSQTTCKREDCFQFGWVTVDSNGNKLDVTCNSGGCFAAGWTDIQTKNGVASQDVVSCINGSCLTTGWISKSSTGATVESVCASNDCAHYGWSSGGGGHTSYTGCKLSDCFENGWTVDVY